MKNISLIVSLLTTVAIAATMIQLQTYNSAELGALVGSNTGLQTAVSKTLASNGQNRREIKRLETRLAEATNAVAVLK